ncbi:MAG: hypothetical protein IJV31_02275 [Clostridia bacterium]|nr:hypothetical protein [Clostridia bacterium]
MSRSGIVNVTMVITEEKILSNIDKVQKKINPNSKKQIIQLEEDAYFKDLIESIKAYLIEYPKKKNFPTSVYKAAYGLVETATNQFEENTKKIEELIRQREENIVLAGKLKDTIETVQTKEEGWKESLQNAEEEFPEDVVESLKIIAKTKDKKSETYKDALKLLNARANNWETNLHIEIDMERIEDRSKALSYIGIEIADALKVIPAPVEEIEEVVKEQNVQTVETAPVEKVAIVEETQNVQTINEQVEAYQEDTTFEAKPSLWQRIKNSKIARAATFIFRIRIKIEIANALPEGRGE